MHMLFKHSKGLNSGLNNGIKYTSTVVESLTILKKWKCDQIQRYFEFCNGHFTKKRPEFVERHRQLNQIVTDFTNLSPEMQIRNLYKTALECGFLMGSTRRK